MLALSSGDLQRGRLPRGTVLFSGFIELQKSRCRQGPLNCPMFPSLFSDQGLPERILDRSAGSASRSNNLPPAEADGV